MFRPQSLLCFLSFAATAAAATPDRLIFEPAEAIANGKHVVLISGDEEYRSEETCPMLAKILARRHGFRCTVLFAIDRQSGHINPNQIDNIPGTEAVADADVVLIATRWRTLPDEQLAPIFDYLNASKPIVAIRTATHAFKSGDYGGYDWSHFGRDVIGEDWLNHHGKHKVQGGRAVFMDATQEHPVLNEVRRFDTSSDIYGIEHLDQSAATILFRGGVTVSLDPASPLVDGPVNDPMMPLAWLKSYPTPAATIASDDPKWTGRCFATTAGASVDFRDESLRRLLVNAVHHLAGLQVPTAADVRFVDQFDPSFYGFQSDEFWERRQLSVADFDWGQSAIVTNR